MTGEQLLAEADIAMYASKESGRSRVAHYGRDTGDATRMHDDLALANRLNCALAGDGLVLFAQPIVAVGADGPAHRFELLLRLRGDDGELLAPGAFLPLSERFGLARRIDRWVIGEALRLAAAHPAVAELLGQPVGDLARRRRPRRPHRGAHAGGRRRPRRGCCSR